ncbi:MAG: N-acetylneuraminate synthase, partial [Bacteroidetes bacterium]|nr:N-acetylneuraminate synthase [Bacteroidota bacterium]
VDAVKFQTFKAEKLLTPQTPKAEYQKKTSGAGTQFEMIKKLELDQKAHEILKDHCQQTGLEFMSTPFDLDSIDQLDDLGVKRYKVGSGDLTNLPLLRHMATKGKPIILSTGMADMREIETVVNELSCSGFPMDSLALLHANTEYPTPYEDVNLQSMLSIKEKFGLRIGYSDHTAGIEVPVAAVALGAEIIEKHFTLDRDMEGPDHKASLEPDELKNMVTAIRHIEQALGDGIKKPSPSETHNIGIARKSLVALDSIREGEIFTEENMGVKRPGTGISPLKWDQYIGSKASRDYQKDELI